MRIPLVLDKDVILVTKPTLCWLEPTSPGPGRAAGTAHQSSSMPPTSTPPHPAISVNPAPTSHFAPQIPSSLREPVPEAPGWPPLWCGRILGARISGPRVTFSRGSRGDGASPTRLRVAHAMPSTEWHSVTCVREDSLLFFFRGNLKNGYDF